MCQATNLASATHQTWPAYRDCLTGIIIPVGKSLRRSGSKYGGCAGGAVTCRRRRAAGRIPPLRLLQLPRSSYAAAPALRSLCPAFCTKVRLDAGWARPAPRVFARGVHDGAYAAADRLHGAVFEVFDAAPAPSLCAPSATETLFGTIFFEPFLQLPVAAFSFVEDVHGHVATQSVIKLALAMR